MGPEEMTDVSTTHKKPKAISNMVRLWLHIPVGMSTIFGLWIHPVLGLIMCLTFLSYEWIEDWRIKDFSYLDKAGYSWGLFCGAVILVILVWVKIIPASLGGL